MAETLISKIRRQFLDKQRGRRRTVTRRRRRQATAPVEALEQRTMLSATSVQSDLSGDADEIDKHVAELRDAANEVADGLGTFFTDFADTLESTFDTVEVPVLSDQIGEVLAPVVETTGNFGAEIRDLLGDVLETVTRAGTTDPIGSFQGALYLLLGPGQAGMTDLDPGIQEVLEPLAAELDAIHLNLLVDGPDLGAEVGPSDVVVSMGTHANLGLGSDVFWTQFDFQLGQVEVFNLDGFEVGLDSLKDQLSFIDEDGNPAPADADTLKFFNDIGLQVNSEAGISATLKWDLRLGFGVRGIEGESFDNRFFLNSGATVSGLATGEGVEEFVASITVKATPVDPDSGVFENPEDGSDTTNDLAAEISLGLFNGTITDGTPTEGKITAPFSLLSEFTEDASHPDQLTITVHGVDDNGAPIVLDVITINAPDLDPSSSPTDLATFLVGLNEQLFSYYANTHENPIPDVAFTLDFATVRRQANPDIATTPTMALSAHAGNISGLTIEGGQKYGFLPVQYENARGKTLGFSPSDVDGSVPGTTNIEADLPLPAEGVVLERPDFVLWLQDPVSREWSKVKISEALTPETASLDGLQASIARLDTINTTDALVEALEELIQTRVSTSTQWVDPETITLSVVIKDGLEHLVIESHDTAVSAAPLMKITYATADRTTLTLKAGIDITDPSFDEELFASDPANEAYFNRLTIAEINTAKASDDGLKSVFEPLLEGEAKIRLHVETDVNLLSDFIPASAGLNNTTFGLPKVSFDFVLDTALDLTETLRGKSKDTSESEEPTLTRLKGFSIDALQFDNVTVDVKDLIQSLLIPFARTATDALGPLFDIFGNSASDGDALLNQRLPIISDLIGRTTLKDLLPSGVGDVIEDLLKLPQATSILRNLLDDPDVGEFRLGGWELVMDPASALYFPVTKVPVPVDLADAYASASDVKAGDFIATYQALTQLSSSGLSVDLIRSPSNVLNLLTGQTFDIVSYGVPDVRFSKTASVPGFDIDIVSFDAEATATINALLRVGYDSTGLERVIGAIRAGAAPDWSALLDGLGIRTRDGNEPEVDLGVELHADGGFSFLGQSADASVDVAATLELDIIDPDNDGKLRLDEIAHLTNDFRDLENLFCMFTLAATFSANGQGGITVTDPITGASASYEMEFDYSNSDIDLTKLLTSGFADCDRPTPEPVLAESIRVDGENVLRLNAGPFAYARLYGDVDDTDGVHFTVTGNATRLEVEAFDADGKPIGQAQPYNAPPNRRFQHILAFGGRSNDQFDFSGVQGVFVEVDGGDGDDTLLAGQGGSLMIGGDGKDTFRLNSGSDTVRTGPGSTSDPDVVNAGQATNEGTDLIDFSRSNLGVTFFDYDAGTGSARIIGSNFDDVITVIGTVRVEGRRGNDELTGEGGEQTLLGGGGIDTLKGGEDNDTLRGGFGNDDLDGGAGDDTLKGQQGDDTLLGDTGADKLFGGSGNDVIIAGLKDLRTTGGSGFDELEFQVDEFAHTGTLRNSSYDVDLNGDDDIDDNGESTAYSQFESLSVTIGTPAAGTTDLYDLTIDGPRTPLTTITGGADADTVEIVNLPEIRNTSIQLNGGDDELIIKDLSHRLSIAFDGGADSDILTFDRSLDIVSRDVTLETTQLTGPSVGTVTWSELEKIEATFGSGADQITVNLAGSFPMNPANVTINGGEGDDDIIVRSVIAGETDDDTTTTVNGDAGIDTVTIVVPANSTRAQFNALGFDVERLEIDDRASTENRVWRREAEEVTLASESFLKTLGADEVIFLGGQGAQDSLEVVDQRSAPLEVTVDGPLVQTQQGIEVVEFGADTRFEDLQVSRMVQGLSDVSEMIVSADGKLVYAVSPTDNSLAVFRTTSSGLEFLQVLKQGEFGVTGIASPSDVVVSDDGRFAYVASGIASTVGVFERLPENDRLVFRGRLGGGVTGGIVELFTFPDNGLFALTTDSELFNVRTNSSVRVLSDDEIQASAAFGDVLIFLADTPTGFRMMTFDPKTGNMINSRLSNLRYTQLAVGDVVEEEVNGTTITAVEVFVSTPSGRTVGRFLIEGADGRGEILGPTHLDRVDAIDPRESTDLVYDPDQQRLIGGFVNAWQFEITITQFSTSGGSGDRSEAFGAEGSDDWELYARLRTSSGTVETQTVTLDDSNGTIQINFSQTFTEGEEVTIELWDADTVTPDDLLLESSPIVFGDEGGFSAVVSPDSSVQVNWTTSMIEPAQEMSLISFRESDRLQEGFSFKTFEDYLFENFPLSAAEALAVNPVTNQLYAFGDGQLVQFEIQETEQNDVRSAEVTDVFTVEVGDVQNAFLNGQPGRDDVETVISQDGMVAYLVSGKYGALTIHNHDAATGEIGSLVQTIDAGLLPGAQIDIAELSDGTTMLYVTNPSADMLQVYREQPDGTFALVQLLVNDLDGNGNLGGASDVVVRSSNGVGQHVYVASTEDSGIRRYSINGTSGELTASGFITHADLAGPSSLALSKFDAGVSTLYVAGSNNKLLAFDVNSSGLLTYRQSVDLQDPTHVVVGSILAGEDRVFVASAATDTVSVYTRDVNGGLTLLSTLSEGQDGVRGIVGVSELAIYNSPFSDNAYLIAANTSGSVVIFQASEDSFVPVQRLRNGAGGVTGIASPTDLTVVTTGSLATLHVSSGGSTSSDGGIGTFNLIPDLDVDPIIYRTFHSGFESLTVETGSGNDLVNAGGIGADITFTLRTNVGSDTVTLRDTPEQSALAENVVTTSIDLGEDDDVLQLLTTGTNSNTGIMAGGGNDTMTVFATGTDAVTDLSGNVGEDTFVVKGTRLESEVIIHGNDPNMMPGDQLIFDPQTLSADPATPGTQSGSVKADGKSFGVTYDTIEGVTILTSPLADAGGPYLNDTSGNPLHEGDAITLDASQTTVPNGQTVVSYTWSIGAATAIATGENPTLTWDQLRSAGIDDDGEYQVSVEVVTEATATGQFFDDIATATLTIANTPPELTAPDGEGEAGRPYQLTLSATDVANDVVHSWTVKWDDNTDDETYFGSSSIAVHTYANPGDYTITITAQDDDNKYTTTSTATIHPASSIAGTTTVPEGAPYTLDLMKSFLPIDGWTIHWGDGGTSTAGSDDSTATHTYADNGSYTITATVDVPGGTDQTIPVANAVSVSVQNVAPVVTELVAPAMTNQGDDVSITVSAFDPGTADTPLMYEFDLDNDGLFETESESPQIVHSFRSVGLNTVAARVSDDDGGVSPVETFEIDVQNVGPTVQSVVVDDGDDDDVTHLGVEGQPVQFVVNASDPGGDRLSYEFDFDGDGTYEFPVAADGLLYFSPRATHTFPDGPMDYTVNVRVTDVHGDTGEGTVTVSIANANPVFERATIKSESGFVEEGTDFTLTAEATDPGVGDVLSYHFDLDNDGTFETPGPGGAITHSFPDNGRFVIPVLISDGEGGTTVAEIPIHVRNVSPTVTLMSDSGPGAATSDTTVSITGLIDDPGVLDTHSIVIDWGDDSSFTTIDAGLTGSFSAPHEYLASGVYSVTAYVTDKDGGLTEQTTTVAITGVGLVDGTLYIIGTEGRDHVTLKVNERKDELKIDIKLNRDGRAGVTNDGTPIPKERIRLTLPASSVERVVAFLYGGNDRYNGGFGHWGKGKSNNASIEIRQLVYGGDGRDILFGGRWSDALFGGRGRDVLWGRGGHDILVGGDDRDVLIGGGGRDLLIGDLIDNSLDDASIISETDTALGHWAEGNRDDTLLWLGSILDDRDKDILLF